MCDPSGAGEGASYLGSFTVTTGTNARSFIQALNVPTQIGTIITLTDTPADNSSSSTSQFSQCQTVTSNGQTGTFSLTPRLTIASANQNVQAALVWTVPAPRVWRNVATIDFRLSTEDRQTAMQVHWDQAANAFSLAGHREAFAPGTPNRLETEWGFLDLAPASVVGSGRTGPSVTLTLPITFKEHA